MSSGRSTTAADERAEYNRGWSEMMLNIWRDRMRKLGVEDTGKLAASLAQEGIALESDSPTLVHKFLAYGVYVDRGVGNGYNNKNRNAKGQLSFLDGDYRSAHAMGTTRVRKRWYSLAYYHSVLRLKEKYIDLLGAEFVGVMATALKEEKK